MDEFERIAAIARTLQAQGPHTGVARGIGDDAAVLHPFTGAQVISVDSAVEGVHFRFEFGSARAIGQRAAVAALSDLAAMGAIPQAMLTALLVPKRFDEQQLFEVVAGLGDAANRYAAPVIGGNLSAASEFSITTTVLGRMEGPTLNRTGAKPGDLLYCSGPIGAAALGLQLCLRGQHRSHVAHPCLQAFLAPKARIDWGRQLVGLATACIDISDGFQQDLGHLCKASNVGALIETSSLPQAPEFATTAQTLGLDPLTLALTGGDDYELLFTSPKHVSPPAWATQVGEITERASGLRFVQHGTPLPPNRLTGFQHFTTTD